MPKKLTLGFQRAKEVMERVSLMQFARVRLRETDKLPAAQAFGGLPLQRTRIWGPQNDRILLQARPASAPPPLPFDVPLEWSGSERCTLGYSARIIKPKCYK